MILEKFTEILTAQLDANPYDITPDTHIGNDLGADSLDVVEMMMAIEDEFGIQIPDEDIEKLRTVGEVVDYITAKTE